MRWEYKALHRTITYKEMNFMWSVQIVGIIRFHTAVSDGFKVLSLEHVRETLIRRAISIDCNQSHVGGAWQPLPLSHGPLGQFCLSLEILQRGSEKCRYKNSSCCSCPTCFADSAWTQHGSNALAIPPVPSTQQKSRGLKFSKSRTGNHVTYICHHNSSRFTFPMFVHLRRFYAFHSLQSITPRIY